jgi:hypothetical protein
MVRNATLKDIPALLNLGLELTASLPVLPDKKKIKQLLTESISNKGRFCQVSEAGGKVIGGMVAISHEGLWFERRHCSILALHSTNPWDMKRMLRNFEGWHLTRRGIKVITTDFMVTARLSKFLKQGGMPPSNTQHILFK